MAGSRGSNSQASLLDLDSGRLSPSEKGRKDGCWRSVAQQRPGLFERPHTNAGVGSGLFCVVLGLLLDQ